MTAPDRAKTRKWPAAQAVIVLPTEPWLSWQTIGFIVAYALAIGLAIFIRWRARRTLGPRSPDAAATSAGDAVACPACGAENDTEYRFCRACVEELPGGSTAPLGTSAPVGQ